MKCCIHRFLILVVVQCLVLNTAMANENRVDTAEFHRSLISIDAHIDIKDSFNSVGEDAGKETMDQFDLPKLRRGALDVAVIALYVGPTDITPGNVATASEAMARKYAAISQFVAEHPDELRFVTTADEIIANSETQTTSILLSSLNSMPFGENVAAIEDYFDKGVRIFGFAHAQNTPFADSSRPAIHFGDVPGEGGGITALGAEAIRLINRLGPVVDVSQLSRQAVLEAVDLSTTPVLATHSAPKSQVDVPRNLSNEEIVKIARSGGVIHVVAFSPWLKRSELYYEHYYGQIFKPVGLPSIFDKSVPRVNPADVLSAEDYVAYKMAYLSFERNIWRYADLNDYVDAIETVVNLVGIDHVGISSDFNHGGGVFGYANVADAPNITERLLQRGFSQEDVEKIWGGNFLRVLRAAEQHASGH